MKSLKYVIFAIFGIGLFFACDREITDYQGDEMAKLNAWVELRNIPAEALKPSGLYYISTLEGTGLTPDDGDYIIYSYKEKSLEGLIYFTNNYSIAKLYDGFDINFHYSPLYTKYDQKQFFNGLNALEGYPINSKYGAVMNIGVYEGLKYMKEGGKATLIMPSKLAYKSNGIAYSSTAVIQGYQSLMYEVELIKVVKDPKVYEMEVLNSFIATNYPSAEFINDSIYYIPVVASNSSVTYAKDSVVYVYYKGSLLDGYVFDTNIDTVAKRLGRTFSSKDSLKVTIGKDVVPGFSQALLKMKKGEWGRAIIPSFSGYDSVAQKSIPAYSTLIFDIFLYTDEINSDVEVK